MALTKTTRITRTAKTTKTQTRGLSAVRQFKGGDLNLGERHSHVTRDDGTVTLSTLRPTTVLSRNCCADFGRPLAKKVMSHSYGGPCVTNIVPLTRTVSEYCSARVSCVGLSTKQAAEPYSDNLLNRTQNPSEPYSDEEIPLSRALRRLPCWLGSQLGIHRKLGLSPLKTVHETVLGHLLTHGGVESPPSVTITETMEMTKTMGIWGANHGCPKQQA